jgi:hypothetical protein
VAADRQAGGRPRTALAGWFPTTAWAASGS